MPLYHNSRSPACRNPVGPVRTGQAVVLRLLGAKELVRADVRLWDGQTARTLPMNRVDESVFEAVIPTPQQPGLMWYDFRAVDRDGRARAYGNAPDGLGGTGQEQDCPHAFQITVYDGGYATPSYLWDGIMYQIFPDRFRRTGALRATRPGQVLHENWNDPPVLTPAPGIENTASDFYGGTLRGIREKLSMLKEMGVTVLYLNPIFLSRSNHRYDTGDYTRVDPMLGDEADFADLCRAAEEMGMRIVLDGVFSHTGDDSVYFNKYGAFPDVGAYQSKDSPYYPWFSFEHYPDKYKCWWDFQNLPTVNKTDESYRRFICGSDGVARRWLRAGASGWRLDVADELPMAFLRSLRAAVKAEKPDALLLGEVWEDASHKTAYGEMRCYCCGDTLDSVMNYPLRTVLIDFLTHRATARDVYRLLRSQQENYPAPFLYALMNLTGSHDRARTINTLAGRDFSDIPYARRGEGRLTEAEYALGKARYLTMLRALCALPGMPCIYYGDEAGMTGGSDPYCRGPYPWGHEDEDLKRQVAALLQERLRSPALRTGRLELFVPDEDTLLIIRTIDKGRDVFGRPFPDESRSVTIRR